MKIATAVVFYYPDSETIRKILAYCEFLDFLVVVDNTNATDHSAAFASIGNVAYKSFGNNQGVARALNTAARIAASMGFSWMMMLDQDSALNEPTFRAIREYISTGDNSHVGIISPLQVSKQSDLTIGDGSHPTRYVQHVMTSGSTLNLKAYDACGPFKDKLFIDHVDSEYCLRLGQRGYRIVQLTRIVLPHSLGETREVTVLGKTFHIVRHEPFRSYYLMRNGLYVAVKYIRHRPLFLLWFFFIVAKSIIKTACFEDKKALRLKMMGLGFLHFFKGRFGQLPKTEHR